MQVKECLPGPRFAVINHKQTETQKGALVENIYVGYYALGFCGMCVFFQHLIA